MDRQQGGADARRGRAWSSDLPWDSPEWAAAEKEARDWKKLLLVIGLGVLSWVATYVGMLELIEANMGELPLVHKAIIGFSVAMLMVMVVWLLDQMFSPIGWFAKACYTFGYVFLTVISVGFGFGFYWKVLESRSESSRSAESAISQVQNSLHAATTRLEQLQATLESLTLLSTQKAEFERANGTSCPGSRPGDGPRRKMREDDAQRFTFASDFVKGRVGAVKGEMRALEGDLTKIVRGDKSMIDAKSGTRNEFMRQVGRKLELTVTGFNAFRSDPQLKQIRSDLAERAEKSSFADARGTTFQCPDAQLQAALRGVVRAIDALPEIERPRIAVVEGSEAVIEAFRRLTATFYGALSFRLPPTPEELRELQKKAVAMAESGQGSTAIARLASMEQAGLSRRDYIPLAIAIFVDLCLLLVSMGRPANRLSGLVPKMRAAERGPVFQILSRFNQIHHDEETREKFEIFRHVVFDYLNDYYVAVPLDAPKVRRMWIEVPRDKVRTGLAERLVAISPPERSELQREAHLLANLFASFERERIFFRIDDRWLGRLFMQVPNVEAARRKLRRQGSKFSEADAFRIYKFSDGAWSEIILGAVMGAARRVEAEKAHRLAETGSAEPPAPAVDQRGRVNDDIFRLGPVPAALAPIDRERPAFGMRLGSFGGHRPEPHLSDPPLSDAARFETRPEPGCRSDRSEPRLDGGAASHDLATAAQFGPYARFVAPVPAAVASAVVAGPAAATLAGRRRPMPTPPEETELVEPANNNTAPSARKVEVEDPLAAAMDVDVALGRPAPEAISLAVPVAAEAPLEPASTGGLIARIEAAAVESEPASLETMARQIADAENHEPASATAGASEASTEESQSEVEHRTGEPIDIDVDHITTWYREREKRA